MKGGEGWVNVGYFEPCDLIDRVDQIGDRLPRRWWQIDGGWWQTGGDGGFLEDAVESVIVVLSGLRVPRLFGVVKGEWQDIFLCP